MSTTTVRPPVAWPEAGPAPQRQGSGLAGAVLTLGLAAVLVAAALEAQGGLQLAQLTTVSVGLCLASGVLCALALVAAGAARRPWGSASLALLALLALLTGLSTTWAIAPDAAWIETNRTLTWLLVFAAGIALVRLSPQRWRSVLVATLLAAVVISVYALLTKVLPAELAEDETYARLREPYGYWNAVGLTAAMGLPIALWLGARREGHGVVAALSHPAIGVLVLTMLLSYSRGAIVAALLGIGFWFVIAPLRLRGAAVLVPGTLLGGLAAAWAFGQSGLSDDNEVSVVLKNHPYTRPQQRI